MVTDPWAVTRARWRAAEDRLYPTLLADPAGYQRSVGAVQAVLVELRRDTTDLDGLLAAEQRSAELLATVQAPPGVPPELLVAVACGIRDRELTATAEQERRVAALAAARAAGQSWARVDGPAVEDLADGRSVAVHLDSETVLAASVDPWSGADPFELQVHTADGAGGTWSGTDRVGWLAAHERARVEIEAGRPASALARLS